MIGKTCTRDIEETCNKDKLGCEGCFYYKEDRINDRNISSINNTNTMYNNDSNNISNGEINITE